MLSRKRTVFDRASGGLRPAALRRETAAKRSEAQRLAARLAPAMGRKLNALRAAFRAQAHVLDSVSYERVLARGFALVTKPGGALVRSAGAIAEGDALRLRFSDGEVAATAGKSAPVPSSSDPQRPRIRRAKRGDDQGSLF
jgi:exodeoxyribonuclease VII large subunit